MAMQAHVPEEITADFLRAMPLPRLGHETDKHARGHVLVFSGGDNVPGAALLVGESALRVGCGKVRVVATPLSAVSVAAALPEARLIAVSPNRAGEIPASCADELAEHIEQADCVIAGAGMIDQEEAGALAERLLRAETRALVLDAACVTGLRDRAHARARDPERVVMTPHAGELATLLGISIEEVRAEPARTGRDAARRYNCTIVVKGARTYVVTPDEPVLRHDGGCVGLATSGSGDVLTGAIGGLMARGLNARQGASWGVFAHGRAGATLSETIAPLGFLAREISGQLPGILARVQAGEAAGMGNHARDLQ
jgi:hydroxyethylthiazole kinase-like uncharacterized protein yjeF